MGCDHDVEASGASARGFGRGANFGVMLGWSMIPGMNGDTRQKGAHRGHDCGGIGANPGTEQQFALRHRRDRNRRRAGAPLGGSVGCRVVASGNRANDPLCFLAGLFDGHLAEAGDGVAAVLSRAAAAGPVLGNERFRAARADADAVAWDLAVLDNALACLRIEAVAQPLCALLVRHQRLGNWLRRWEALGNH